MKQFTVDRHTTPGTPVLDPVNMPKVPVYDTMADAEADLSNLEAGQIVMTPDEGAEELLHPVAVVEKDNTHAVQSGAVFDFCTPDWANAQAITINTTTPFEAPSDGWIVGYASNNLTQTIASINGVEVAKSLSTTTYTYAMNLNIRVSKGDTMTISADFYVQKLSFVPSKQGA